MKSVILAFLAVAALALQDVKAQDYNLYSRRYRRPVVIISSNRGVRTYVPPPAQDPNSEIYLSSRQDAKNVCLDVYYETDCPDSMRFITRQLYPLYQEMEDVLNITLIPYGKAYESYNPETQQYDFRCQHGPSECFGNTVQSCVISLYNEKDYINFINCMENYPRPSHSGAKCARRLSLDWDKIEKCVKGDEGNRLLHEMAQRTENLNPKLYFVPWIVVDKVYSRANQRMALRNLKGLVCDTYKGKHPNCEY